MANHVTFSLRCQLVCGVWIRSGGETAVLCICLIVTIIFSGISGLGGGIHSASLPLLTILILNLEGLWAEKLSFDAHVLSNSSKFLLNELTDVASAPQQTMEVHCRRQ